MRRIAATLLWMSALATMSAQGAAAQATHLLVISGLGGEESYSNTFREWALTILDAAAEAGVPAGNIHYLGESTESDPERIEARSTKENVEAAFEDLAASVGDDDQVWVVVIGHGSDTGGEARINLPGPDMSAADFARNLDLIDNGTVAFVNTASASGGFLPQVAASGRVVVTATKSAGQRNETVFGGYFAGAFSGATADANKDGRVSLLEAFDYSRHEVERHYDQGGLMATEHALLEDDGDGEGSTAPSLLPGEGASSDGRLASRVFLGKSQEEIAAGDSEELTALFNDKRRLETRIEVLRAQKSSLPETLYLEELESLAVELALIDRQIRELQGPKPAQEQEQEP